MSSGFDKAIDDLGKITDTTFDAVGKAMERVFDEADKMLDKAKLGGTGVQIPAGKKLVKRLSYTMPETFVSIQEVPVYGRKPWEKWLPERLYLYTLFIDQ